MLAMNLVKDNILGTTLLGCHDHQA